jgi:subtilisin family serine protease
MKSNEREGRSRMIGKSIRGIAVVVLALLGTMLTATVGQAAEPPPLRPPSDGLKLAGSDSAAASDQGDASDQGSNRIPGHYIVVLEDYVEHPGGVAEAQAERHGGKLGLVYRHAIKGYSAALSKEEVESLRRNPKVKSVSPDYQVQAAAQTIPTGVERSFATENLTANINGLEDTMLVDVAVIDSGIGAHADLRVVSKTNCVPPGENTGEGLEKCVDGSGTDLQGHGTHVAGTIGARDNTSGVVGNAPGAGLWAVRVLNKNGSGALSWIIAGIDWVTFRSGQIEVANMSLGCLLCESPAMKEAIDASIAAGVVYVVAAGNEGVDVKYVIPASYPDVITVAALSDTDGKPGGTGSSYCNDDYEPQVPIERQYIDDGIAPFSNGAAGVDIVAPGGCILSTAPENGYTSKSGTSMASPHVAGAAALLAKASNPNSKADVIAIRNTLVSQASLAFDYTQYDAVSPLLHLDSEVLTGTEAITGMLGAGETSLTTTSALVVGGINPRGLKTEYWFEYGTSASYGSSAPITPKEVAASAGFTRVSETLSGLQADTTYHYRLVAKNSSGTFVGKNHTFTTRAVAYSTMPRGLEETKATLSGVLDKSKLPEGISTTYEFEYGLTSKYGQSVKGEIEAKPEWSYGSQFEHVIAQVSGLVKATTYHYRIVAKNSSGTFYGRDQLFRTAAWSRTAPPEASSGEELRGVSCWAASECMAVGSEPYTLKKSGSTWESVSRPSGGDTDNLNDVSCVSKTFCIAVGGDGSGVCNPLSCGFGENTQPVSMRWDGSKWTSTSTPLPAESIAGTIRSVSCVSSTACFAVGEWWKGIGKNAIDGEYLSLYWNGSTWALQAMPPTPLDGLGVGRELRDVSCLSTNFCFAVGSQFLKWDGSKWTPVPQAFNTGFGYTVACSSATFCMAMVGGGAAQWDGEKWTRVLVGEVGQANFSSTGYKLIDFSDLSCTATWSCTAVGRAGDTIADAIAIRWDGKSWSRETSSTPPEKYHFLALGGVSCVSAARCTAVGNDYGGAPHEGLIEEYDHEVAPPSASTDAATDVRLTGGTLNATVNGGSLPTTYRFEYDTKEYKAGEGAHGTSVPLTPEDMGSSSAAVAVSQKVGGLKPLTTYHYRVVASNPEGTVNGSNRSFTTHRALVGAYSFNEGSGATLGDSAGNHDGSVEGASWTASGKYGSALDFDGTNDLVKVADAADLDLTKTFTLEAWVKPDSLSSPIRAVLAKAENPGTGLSGYQLLPNFTGKPTGYVANAGKVAIFAGPTALPTSQWSHLAFSSDGTTLRLYVDGQQVATASAIDAAPTAAALEIGHNQVSNGYFDGLIDEVRIYDVPLSQAQIQVDRDAPVAEAAYSFNEGSGATLGDSAGNHDGTVEGASWTGSGKYGAALDFDGTNDWVKVADAAELDLTKTFTLEAWVKPDSLSSPARAVLAKAENPGTGLSGYQLLASFAGDPAGYVANAGKVAIFGGSTALPTGQWSHLAFSSDGTTLRLYVDGSQVATAAAIEAAGTAGPLRIGHNPVSNGYFDGLIDEVRVYDVALSEGQIQADRDTGV